MRIVNRATFMQMPANTFFKQAFEPWAWQDLMIKFDSLETDFVSMGLDWPEGAHEGPHHQWDTMLEAGASVPLDVDAAGRDGYFEDNAIFMVYEVEDLIRLRKLIDDAISTAQAA